MNYLSPKLGRLGNNRLNTPQTRILWLQEPGWGWGKWGKRETVPHRGDTSGGWVCLAFCFFLLFFSFSSLSLEFFGLVVVVSLFPIFPLFCWGGAELDCVSPAPHCKELHQPEVFQHLLPLNFFPALNCSGIWSLIRYYYFSLSVTGPGLAVDASS